MDYSGNKMFSLQNEKADRIYYNPIGLYALNLMLSLSLHYCLMSINPMQGKSALIDTQGEWIYDFEYIEFIREFKMSSLESKNTCK